MLGGVPRGDDRQLGPVADLGELVVAAVGETVLHLTADQLDGRLVQFRLLDDLPAAGHARAEMLEEVPHAAGPPPRWKLSKGPAVAQRMPIDSVTIWSSSAALTTPCETSQTHSRNSVDCSRLATKPLISLCSTTGFLPM